MKSTHITMKRGTSEPVINGIRQYAMTYLRAWRPVAFSLNREITYLEAKGDVLTMPLRFSMDLSDCVFEPLDISPGKDIIVDTITFSKDLYPSGLSTANFKVRGREDVPLLSTLESTVELKVIYRYGAGLYKTDQNSMFLEESGIDLKDYIVLGSRHTNVSLFTFDIKVVSESEETLTVSLESDIGNEQQILVDATTAFRNAVSQVLHSMVDSLDFQTTT